MRLLFTWDAEAQRTEATEQNIVADENIEQMLARGAGKAAVRDNLILNARLDSLDAVEAQWWAMQQRIQDAEEPGQSDLDARAALEADNGWLATYRGQAGDPRPDMSAEVLTRIKGFARRWFITQVRQRFDAPVTIGSVTVAFDELTRALMFARASDMAMGNAYGTPGVAVPLADDSGTIQLSEAEFKVGIDAMRDLYGNGADWMHSNVQAVNSAADLDATLDVLA